MNAPEYTKKEKQIYALKHAAWIFPLFAFGQFYFLPAYKKFSDLAPCQSYFGINGAYFVFTLLYAAPIFTALLLGLIYGKEYVRVFRLAQYPLPNQKTFTPTLYVYGFKARIRICILVFVIVVQILIGIHGLIWSTDYVRSNLDTFNKNCAGNTEAMPVSTL
ncbi:MAG TPA: hypothetical protein VIZ65_09420 [Cellvibrionaceae bacterium]